MKAKILQFAICAAIGTAILLFGQKIDAFAEAEHLINGTDTSTHTVPSNATLNSYGELSFESNGNSIRIDSSDIHLLQSELKSLYAEIDAYTGSNTAGF